MLLQVGLLSAPLVVAVTVNISANVPSDAPVISPSLTSFSIEGDRWTDWSGTTSRNEFFFNCLDNLRRLTGAPPDIRIGANSEDRTNYNPNIKFSEAIFPNYTTTVPYPEALNITVGDGYYQTAKFLPPHTRVTWGVNLGQYNLTAAYLETKSLIKAFKTPEIKGADITLDFIDIGNEADLYRNNGFRSSNYNSTPWVKEWTLFATNISKAAGMSSNSRTKFRLGSFAASSHDLPPFSPQLIFRDGVLNSEAGKLATVFSQHRYSGSFCQGNGALLQDLMTKKSIRGNITVFSPDITVVKSKGLDYILGETNSFACHGAPGVSNAAGAALWTLDYLLFAPQAGISKVFFHEGIGFKYNLIQPVTLTRSTLDGSPLPSPLPPHVQPQYYAAIIASEAIGATGSSRAVELVVNDNQVSGYAFYEHDTIVRAVFINLRAFLRGREASSRSAVHIDLALDASLGQTVTIKRLKIEFADDTSGLTWGGQTYETATARPKGDEFLEEVDTKEGFDISETEAVLVHFN